MQTHVRTTARFHENELDLSSLPGAVLDDDPAMTSVPALLAALARTVRALHSSLGSVPGMDDASVDDLCAGLESLAAAPASGARAADASAILRGGLAPWQVRVVSAHIESQLDGAIRIEALAEIARLSPSYFARAFNVSFGCPPHRYLMQRRLKRAQGLMLATDAPLGQIAIECGLADQSHLNRLFQLHVGETPSAWRRARRPAHRSMSESTGSPVLGIDRRTPAAIASASSTSARSSSASIGMR